MGEEHVEQRAEVFVFRLEVEDARTARAEQRLEDDVPVLGTELADRVAVGGDQGRRHQLGEVGDEEFLRRVAHGCRIVDHQGPGMDVVQDMGRGDVGEVEGRVLAQQNHVEAGEIDGFGCAEQRGRALDPLHGDAVAPGGDLTALETKGAGQVVKQLMAAPLCFLRQGEGGIRVDIDGFHRVHLQRDGEGHEITPDLIRES